MSSPACVERRLGQVTASIGSREPNLRTEMAPGGISYRQAFEKLAMAAVEKGGNAVVLREQQADYFTKGARRARRPTYVSLQGAVLILADNGDECSMTVIDPSKFEQDSTTKQRNSVVKNAGVSF